jgi:hypothetical protein
MSTARKANSSMPPAWTLLIAAVFEASEGFAAHLWRVFPKSEALARELKLLDAVNLSRQLLRKHCARILEMVRPQDLVEASLRLAPECSERPRDAVAFESAVLALTSRDGHWQT